MINRSENIADKFKDFISNLNIESRDKLIDSGKEVSRIINRKYWGISSDLKNTHFIGSFGRKTAIKGISNINLLVILPDAIYQRYENFPRNPQAALLREIQDCLNDAYKDELAQVDEAGCLIIPLPNEPVTIEIVPGFFTAKKQFLYPEFHQGWHWSFFNPLREIEIMDEYNYNYGGKVKHLAKMMRAWKRTYQAPIPPILIDTLAMNFMDEWEGKMTSYSYYGQMVKDFLEYLTGLRKQQLIWYAKGSNRQIDRDDDFSLQAELALQVAQEALVLEKENDYVRANMLWERVFGPLFMPPQKETENQE